MVVRVRDHQDADSLAHNGTLVAARASSLTGGATRGAVREVSREKPLAIPQREELKDRAKHSDNASNLGASVRLFSFETTAARAAGAE